MKKALFIDRDGTILAEPADEQIDSLQKFEFVPGAISALKELSGLGYELVMVSNQDGLGTPAFPESDFEPLQKLMLDILASEGVKFDDILIDRSFPEDNAPTRKPRTGMLGAYTGGSYDLAGSFVIGDRDSDMQLASNLGARGLQIGPMSWRNVVDTVRGGSREAEYSRTTRETSISVKINLESRAESSISTGLRFFDHMLEQIPHHAGISLSLSCKGDLDVDEHHTVEDCGIALGKAFREALGSSHGIGRYGFALPMDESRAMVLLDIGGRSELVWDVTFTREYVGDLPTEMIVHFFKSFCNALGCNMYVSARGENNHHLAECVFKAFARSLGQAVRRNTADDSLPSSKGLL
ncbi:MAG: bifunctional histidinol-phosphatase/imidazoleglycerol-phosphate dehydratase HisB [Bacteroidales bacterium]|nr:bifunctional histidinol-phosphatase/imidazoleglycerol-phosphate dehydratase HisB [Bacteroidales bacterium]